MLKNRDLHTCYEIVPIAFNNVPQGTLLVEYDVREYSDVRNLTESRAYIVSCSQRIIMAPPASNNPWWASSFPPAQITSFANYLAVLANSIQLVPPSPLPSGFTCSLLDYSPKTLNTAVVTSQNQSSDSNTSISSQHTTGSSTAQTNSYDVSASLGFFGEDPTGGVSVSSGQSTTYTTDKSDSSGTSSGRGTEAAAGASMSIKDWGSYASIDPANEAPSWIWGQEYPWNVLELYNMVNGNVVLPDYVQARLFDSGTGQLFPPSQLSLNGLNFVSRARWVVTIPEDTPIEALLTFNHKVNCFTATHSVTSSTSSPPQFQFAATLNQLGTFAYTSSPAAPAGSALQPGLNLPLLGLDPIVSGSGNGAVAGFSLQQFIAPPPSPPASNALFGIKSTSNNLYVTGQGFDAPASNDAPLSTSFPSGVLVQLTVYFKITSLDDNYALYLKHWRTAQEGCVMNIVVNNQAPIFRHVDSLEAGSGSDNVSTITLRSKSYSSVDYYDYLVLGLNTIQITIAPSQDAEGSGTSGGYAIRALAIG